MGQFRYTDISWIFYMSGSSAFWDLAGLPSVLPVYGVTPDSSVVVRISAEVVFAHFLVLVSVRFLICPALALFPRRRLCHLTFVPFSSARLTIWWKNITQVVVVMVSKTKSMSKILLINTFVALGDVTQLPSPPLIHGVAPDSRHLARISTKVVPADFFEPVPVRLLFRPLLANPSRNCPCDASLVIFASFAIRIHILTFWWSIFFKRQYLELQSPCK